MTQQLPAVSELVMEIMLLAKSSSNNANWLLGVCYMMTLPASHYMTYLAHFGHLLYKVYCVWILLLQDDTHLKRFSTPLPPISPPTPANNPPINDPRSTMTAGEIQFVNKIHAMGFPVIRAARAVKNLGCKEREVCHKITRPMLHWLLGPIIFWKNTLKWTLLCGLHEYKNY